MHALLARYRGKIFFFGLFTTLTAILYGPSLWYDYTYMDDHQLILKNWQILSDLSQIDQVFREDVFFNAEDAYYRPLLTLSLMVDAQLGGTGLFFFHLTNLLLHILCCFLVFVLLERLRLAPVNAALLSAVFCVHPLLVQAVAWVPGRNDTLLALFVLASFLFLWSFVQVRKRRYAAAHLVFFTAALFTKETVVLFLGVCLMGIFFLKSRRLTMADWVLLGGGWFSACALYWLMRQQAMVHPVPIDYVYLFKSFVIGIPGLLQYVGKMILPLRLSVLPVIRDSGMLWPLLGILIFGLLMVWRWSRMQPSITLFSLLWIVLFLMPAILRPNPGIMINFLEHRTYLPMIGVLMMVGQMQLWPERFSSKHYVLLVVFLLFFARSWLHRDVFQDKKHFWENAARTSPSAALAQFNLGVVYYDLGEKERAASQFQKSLQLDSLDIPSIVNLGTLAMERGAYAEAEARLLSAIAMNEKNGYAFGQLAQLYEKMGRPDAAKEAKFKARAYGYAAP